MWKKMKTELEWQRPDSMAIGNIWMKTECNEPKSHAVVMNGQMKKYEDYENGRKAMAEWAMWRMTSRDFFLCEEN